MSDTSREEAINNLRNYVQIVDQDRCVSQEERDRLWAEFDASIQVLSVPVEPVGYIDISTDTDWWDDVDRFFYGPGLSEGPYAVVRLEADDE